MVEKNSESCYLALLPELHSSMDLELHISHLTSAFTGQSVPPHFIVEEAQSC